MEKFFFLVSKPHANPPLRVTALVTQQESYPSHRRAQLAHAACVHFQPHINGAPTSPFVLLSTSEVQHWFGALTSHPVALLSVSY